MKSIVQFSYKHHGDPKLGPVIDCRVIPNPWRRGDNATDEERMERVRQHPLFPDLVQQGVRLLQTHDSISVGCLFGKHRSGAVANEIAKRIGGAVVVNMSTKGPS